MQQLGPEDFAQTGGLIVTAVAPPGAGEPDVEVSAAPPQEGEEGGAYAADAMRGNRNVPGNLASAAEPIPEEDPWEVPAFGQARAQGLPGGSRGDPWGMDTDEGPFGRAVGGGAGAGAAVPPPSPTPLTLPPWHVSAINKQVGLTVC
jgi:hypothetical protein